MSSEEMLIKHTDSQLMIIYWLINSHEQTVDCVGAVWDKNKHFIITWMTIRVAFFALCVLC